MKFDDHFVFIKRHFFVKRSPIAGHIDAPIADKITG